MTDLTIGQRIAQCRRQLNLSQEALGEKMGVSRQAISKWESDGALPEIDKLIALSRLFGVSIGWLLGVEAAPEPNGKEDLSEALLQKIDGVVRRYAPKKRTLSPGKKILLAILAALLAIGGLTFFREWRITRNEVGYVSAQIRNTNDQYAYILNRLTALENQLQEQAISPSGFSLATYSFSVEPHEENPYAIVNFSAVPASWNSQYKAILSVRREDKDTLPQTCAWDGMALRAQLALEVEDGYEFWLTVEYPDGSQESLELPDETVQALKGNFEIRIDPITGTGHFNTVDGTLTLTEYITHVSRPYLLETCSNFVAWEKVEYRLYHHGPGAEGTWIDSFVLYDRSADPDEEIPGTSQIHEMGFPQDTVLPLPEGETGDSLSLYVYVEMSNGMVTLRQIDGWAYDGDGIFRDVWEEN